MSGKAIVSVIQLVAMTSLVISPAKLLAIEDCSRKSPQGQQPSCTARSSFKTQPETLSQVDKDFNTVPSCKEVNNVLDEFAAAVKKMAKVVSKSNSTQVSLLDQMQIGQLSSSPGNNYLPISSKDLFSKRLAISPVAKQSYFNYLQSQEAFRGSFDRPVLNFQLDLNSNPEFSESVNGFISPIPVTSYTSTYETNPSIGLYYPFSFENLFTAKSLKQQETSNYYTFIDQAISDSLGTVSNFYEFKSNMLSTVLYSFQYQAAVDRVNRLRRLEKKGLSSRLDISRANVTSTSQATSLLNSKAALSQSYDKIAGDLLFPEDFATVIFPRLTRGLSTACWNKAPSASLAIAINNNPALAALRYKIKSSQLATKSILSRNLPQLSISVSYEADNQWGDINGTGTTSDYSQTRDAVASASFNWNIFDFGQTFANAKSQRYATDSLRNQLTQSLSQLETDVLTNFSAYISSSQNVVALAKASQEATLNYVNALKASQVGILNETDVDNIFNQLTSINSSLVDNLKARNNSAVAIAQLVQTEGLDNIEFDQFLTEWKKSFSKVQK